MKVYHGRRTEHGCAVEVEENREVYLLNPRNDLRHRSQGLEWSYAGSGPAQLALALAADVLGDDELAQQIYQRLTLSRLPLSSSQSLAVGPQNPRMPLFAALRLDAGKMIGPFPNDQAVRSAGAVASQQRGHQHDS